MAAKSKVPKRISILASDEVAALPELQELAEKGHQVDTFTCPTLGLADYDLILSDSACAFVPGLEKWLADAVKGARTRRYGNVAGLATEV